MNQPQDEYEDEYEDEQYEDEPQLIVNSKSKSIIKKPTRQPKMTMKNQESEAELLKKLVQELYLSQKQNPRTRIQRTEKVQQQQQQQMPRAKKSFKNIGNREEVFNGSAMQTSGGLRKKDLMLNSKGMIVSRAKSESSQRLFKK